MRPLYAIGIIRLVFGEQKTDYLELRAVFKLSVLSQLYKI
jgi:hypothetical protein